MLTEQHVFLYRIFLLWDMDSWISKIRNLDLCAAGLWRTPWYSAHSHTHTLGQRWIADLPRQPHGVGPDPVHMWYTWIHCQMWAGPGPTLCFLD